MNTREKNKYEMIGAVSTFYERERDSFTNVPAAAAVFSDLKQIHKEIGLNEKVVNEGTKGKVISKDISQDEIVKTGLVITGALYGYAATENDAELMTFADVNSKTFSKLRDSEIPIHIDKILEKANALADKLIPYGITEEKRNDARVKLDNYIEKFGIVSAGKVTKKSARETNLMLFEKADQKFKVLDKLMLGFKESNSDLYSRYNAARVIYDKTGSRKGEEDKSASSAKTTTVNSSN